MMTEDAFEDAVRAHLKREPFRPFAIETDTGDRWVVNKPKELYHHAGTTAVFFAPDGSINFIDCDNVRRLLDVESAASA